MHKRNHTIGLGLTTAMAAAMLSGCATGNVAPRAEVSAAQAQLAMANGEYHRAIQAAEAAVTADPRNPTYRMTLGNAYLEAGRFAAASTSFEDAVALGDNSPRAALSLALALNGQARFAEAASLLGDWENEIAPADLGLAFALSGQPERGIHILSNAIRSGDNNVKTRQNLAYAYAVAGRWREARMMVAQDVGAHDVGARLSEWAQMTHAEAYNARVAGLLGVPANVRDAGQPIHLALANHPGATQLASEGSGYEFAQNAPDLAPMEAPRMSVPATAGELPSVSAPEQIRDSAPAPTFAQAFVPDTPLAVSAQGDATPFAPVAVVDTRYVGQPVVQPVAGRPSTDAAPAPRRAAAATPALARPQLATSSPIAAPAANSSHLVQLGSFSSEAGARRAWGIYQSRYPELAEREMVITRAVVDGRNYWRVSAGGFDRASSRAMCGRVDATGGEGCISWAANTPLPGAIDRRTRFARR